MEYIHCFPKSLVERDGPFREFKQDGAIVSVELKDGTIFGAVLLVYPDIIGAMPEVDSIPFAVEDISKIFQTEDNIGCRSSSKWTFFLKNKKAEQAGDGDAEEAV